MSSHTEYMRDYRATHPEYVEAQAARRREAYKDPEKKARMDASQEKFWASPKGFVVRLRRNYEKREKRYLRKYGITETEKLAMLEAQGGVCKSCGSSDPGNEYWHTDHIHGTTIIRGILCHGCNTAIGGAKDDPTKLRMMAKYLEDQSFLLRSVI